MKKFYLKNLTLLNYILLKRLKKIINFNIYEKFIKLN